MKSRTTFITDAEPACYGRSKVKVASDLSPFHAAGLLLSGRDEVFGSKVMADCEFVDYPDY